jgi:hypothetical protein
MEIVKPVLRGHLWDKERWSFKTGDLLKEVQFIWNFLWQDKKKVTLNTDDCLIEVNAWADLTLHIYYWNLQFPK